MRRKEQLIDHGLIKLFLFALVMLTPFSAWAQTITVGGVDATDATALQTAYGTTVSFDSQTNTLTLNGAKIDMSNTDGYPVSSSIANLKVKLLGVNTFTLFSDKPNAFNYTGEENTKTLTFTTSSDYTKYGSLRVNGIVEVGSICPNYTLTSDFIAEGSTAETTGWYFNTNTEINTEINAYINIYYLEYYDLWLDTSRYTSQSLSKASGFDTYDPSTNTLKLIGGGYESYGFISKMAELKVSISGNNTMKSFAFQPTDQVASGTLTISKNSESSSEANSLTLSNTGGVITGFSTVTINNPLHVTTPATEPEEWTATITSAVITDQKEDITLRFGYPTSTYFDNGSTENLNFSEASEYTAPVLKRVDANLQSSTDLTGLSITYSSSDENVATIDATGKLTIVGGGYTTISAVSAETSIYNSATANYKLAVRPSAPSISLSDGVYYTGQKLSLTATVPNGTMSYKIGYEGTETAYSEEIELAKGEYTLYAYTTCTNDLGTYKSYDGRVTLYVYDKLSFSPIAGTYNEEQEVEITNLPTSTTYSPQVYYLVDDETIDETNDEAQGTLYTSGKKIPVDANKSLKAYIYLEGDSGKKYKSEVVEAQYVIRQDPSLVFKNGDDFSNRNLVVDATIGEAFTSPVVKRLDNDAVVDVDATLSFTYSSSDPAVATVAADGTVTPVGVGTTTITASSVQTDAYTAGTATYTLNVYKNLSHSSITIEVAEATYNGAPLEPAVTVKDGETSIAEFVSVAYSNNTNAALSTAETAPTVTITPKELASETNWYTGTASKTFTITAMSLENAQINDIDDQPFTGEAITPTLMVTEGDKILVLDTDYIVAYSDNVNAGTATATITGKGNYQGTKSKTFTITAKSLATGYTVSVDATQTYTYTGSAITPGVTVAPVGGGDALVLDTDYTVSYSNNVNAAKADDATAPTVTVTGKGNYTGTASAKFTIEKATPTITTAPTAKDLTYTGEAQELVTAGVVSAGTMVYSMTLTGTFSETIPTGTNADTYSVYYKVNGNDNYNGIDASETNKVAVEIKKATITEVTLENPSLSYTGEEQTATIASVKAGDLELTADDYDVSGNQATAQGSYELTVTAKENSNFTGSKTATFSIGAANITDLYDISLAETSYVYDGTEHKPAVIFKENNEPVELSTDDYDVTYSNNVNVGSAEATTGAPTVTVTGKGNLTGSKTLTFTITAMSLNNAIVGVASATYSGSEVEPTVTVKLTADSTPLELDKDYTVAYSNNINAASADATTAPTATITGKGNYTGSQSVKFTIDQKTVTAAMIDGIDNQTYTGSAITPTLTVKDGTTTLVLNTDYSVDYEDNVNVGIATATITGEGNYKGTASKTFTIDPKTLTADMVTLNPEKVEYNGATQKPEVTVADGTALTANDYTIENNGGVEVGKYDVVVTAKGNYTGKVTKQFEIVNLKLKAADVTFSENWASFYHPTENIDLPEGVAAYVLTAVGETTATATQISYIPAGVAVLLQNNVTTTTTNTSAEGNLMFHADEAVDVTTVGGTVYGLYNGKLMRVASGTIPAGKNFLMVSKPIGAPQLTITTDDTTAIEVLENAAALENGTDEWFTLDGRKLQQKPTKKGLYIKNGKTVVVNNK